MAEQKTKNIYYELGQTGLTRFGGQIFEEWLRELSGQKAIKKYKEMRDNDPIVGAFLYAVKMLTKQVSWTVEQITNDKQGEEAAEFLKSCLFDMSISWHDLLSEILSCLPFGWSYFEVVCKKRNGFKFDGDSSKYTDGKIGWRKWAIRAQETLNEWKFDENGGIEGMVQQVIGFANVFIPIGKSLLFRTEVEKNNPEGRSILRNGYRPWYLKKNIEEVEGIGIERDLAGLPVMWVPPSIVKGETSDDVTAREAYKKAIRNIRRDQQEGVLMPLAYDSNGNKLYDITLLSTGGRRQFDTNGIIQRYDQRIAMTVMADFLLLGHEKVGSFALSSSKTNLFSIALGSILDSITDVINTYAVPRLFALNTFKLDELPKLKHGDVETVDLKELGEFISKLSGAGCSLFPDENLEAYIREQAGWPEKMEDDVL